MENLKFRAWDKEDNRMKEVFNLDFHRYTAIVGFRLSEPKSFLGNDPLIIMQSTGLKDKHGVDIFEGDIVNVHDFINVGGIEGYEEGEREMIGIVKYGCIFNSPIPEWYLENSDDYIPFSYIDLHDESFEVLGNKFEHKELLEYDSE